MMIKTITIPERKWIFVLVAVALSLVLLMAARPAFAGGRPFSTELTGAAEVPGPGDPDGSGSAHLTLNQGQGEVCFHLVVEGIAPATAAHIHVGAAGVAGPVVVGLVPPTGGESSGCVSADLELIKAIRQNPDGYYVNVHNPNFPAGAVRGQLSK